MKYIYTYIYIERERERDRDRETETETERERERERDDLEALCGDREVADVAKPKDPHHPFPCLRFRVQEV